MFDIIRELWPRIIAIALVILLVCGGSFLFYWYKACVQVAVYKRQGIEMDTWEVFCGAKPAEQVIRVK